jgi:hypothetical protein
VFSKKRAVFLFACKNPRKPFGKRLSATFSPIDTAKGFYSKKTQKNL